MSFGHRLASISALLIVSSVQVARAEEPAARAAPVAQAQAQVPAPSAGTATANLALTVSGGISLGSYEAGLNWGLLRLFRASMEATDAQVAELYGRRVDLKSMTGASAGNINALLSAVEWCKKPDTTQEAFKKNLFWSSWIPVGIDQLLPQDRSCEEYQSYFDAEVKPTCHEDGSIYNADDGIFSRKAFEPALAQLRDVIEHGEFEEGCEFPFSVTLTKETPEQVEGGFQALTVPTQRFSVLLTVKVTDGKLGFTQPSRDNASPGLVGNRIFLPEDTRGAIEVETIIRVVTASSAFPGAFGPVTLPYCPSTGLDADGRCTWPRTDQRFLDGGVFDNLPIGLALHSLARLPDDKKQGRVPEILYLDPEQLRGDLSKSPLMRKPRQPGARERAIERARKTMGTGRPYSARVEPQRPAPPEADQHNARGYTYLVSLLKRLVTVARNYELQSTLRFADQKEETHVSGTTRRSPIFGNYLAAFAGFLARPLREYDYYVGLYDALFHVAQGACRKSTTPNDKEPLECIADHIQRYAIELKIHDATALTVIEGQLSRELAHAAIPHHARLHPSCEPLIGRLHEAILSAELEPKAPTLEWVLSRVRVDGDVLSGLSTFERALFVNRPQLLGATARRIAQRLVDIERAEPTDDGLAVISAVQLGTEVYFNGREYKPRLVPDPSTIPHGEATIARALPYYVMGNLIGGGLEVGWLPSWYWGFQPLGVSLPLSPLSWDRGDGRAHGNGQVDWRAGIAPFWLPPTLFDRIEAGPYVAASYADSDQPSAYRFGGELSVQALRNHLRISVAREWTVDGWKNGHWMLRLGVSNFDGLVYWLFRFL